MWRRWWKRDELEAACMGRRRWRTQLLIFGRSSPSGCHTGQCSIYAGTRAQFLIERFVRLEWCVGGQQRSRWVCSCIAIGRWQVGRAIIQTLMTCVLYDYTASKISTAKLSRCLGEVSLTKKTIAMQSDGEKDGKRSYANMECGGMLSGHDVEQQLWWCVAQWKYLCSRV